jgi:arginine/lysine/histidine transporter system substrate-binding protein
MQFYAQIFIMKKIFFGLVIFLGLFGCSNHEQEDAKIRVGTSPDYPPFEFKSSGNITGFDIELVKKIAQKLNKQVEIVEMDFASLIPSLQSEKIDVVASGLTITNERKQNIDFSHVYYQASIAAISKSQSPVLKITDLANKKIGTQLGSIMASFAYLQRDVQAGISVTELANNMHLLQELKIGRIDVLLLEEGQVQDFLSKNPDLIATVFDKTGEGYAFGFKKASKLKNEFDNVIEQLKQSDEILKLEQKWLKQASNNANSLINSLAYIPFGIIVTLKYALLSVFFGLIIGSLIAFARLSSYKLLNYFAIIYLSIFRGTPLLLQLFIIYFALPMMLGSEVSAFLAGIVAFSLNSGAYVSENIRAGIESVDKGQFEAAKSLGLSFGQSMRYIILPQAIKNIMPSLVNEAINMIKESSIISVIGEADIMRRANVVSAEHYSYFEPLMVAALCYYVLVLIFSSLAKIVERRMKGI